MLFKAILKLEDHRLRSKLWLFILLIQASPVLAKSMESMGRSAQTSLKNIGVVVVGLGIMSAGFTYIFGGDGKQRIYQVSAGALCIFGFAAILALFRHITGF